MSVWCLLSAHGSPGVTTTTLALAGVWPDGRRCLVVEADPAGGMIAARFGLGDSPGMASLAAQIRHGVGDDMVWRHAQELPGGVPVLVAPPSADQVHALLQDLAEPLARWGRAQEEVDVVVDCGRFTPEPPHLGLLGTAHRVLMVTHPSPDQLRPAAHGVQWLAAVGVEAMLVTVGNAPYPPEEVASALAIDVAGAVAWDPKAAQALCGHRGTRDLRRSQLVRSVALLARGLGRREPHGQEVEEDSPVASFEAEHLEVEEVAP